ncbi:integrase [Gossypium australe]|uniref:Integrase n=1 Tax=Gossypium australe TaxID=47621 RepID=A0A5B6UYH1_9ROSI|nr:integrase [Gossypium australe]
MIPEWKWERVTMDFVSGLPLSSKKKDTIDHLTKSAYFIPVRPHNPVKRDTPVWAGRVITHPCP